MRGFTLQRSEWAEGYFTGIKEGSLGLMQGALRVGETSPHLPGGDLGG